MHMAFFTVVAFLEAVTALRLSSLKVMRTSDKQLEMLSLGVTNIILGMLGLLPVSIPVARNLLAREAGGNHKVYLMFSFILLFVGGSVAWPIIKCFPRLAVSAIGTTLGLLIVDLTFLYSTIKTSPFLALPIGILVIGSLFFDMLTVFTAALLIFYLVYFNIGGVEYFRVEKVKSFFETLQSAKEIETVMDEEAEEEI